MTKELHQRIEAALRRNPGHKNNQITKNLNGACRTADVQMVREKLGLAPAPPPSQALPAADIGKGVPLASRRVLSRRPAESAAKFIRRLPRGRGFDLKDLSHEWGMSEETVRKHARDLGCLKFVEVSEDEWVQMVMNPETAANYTL